MKTLKPSEYDKVNGGAANAESSKVQDGLLLATLEIPPHNCEQSLDIFVELQNPKK